MKIFVLLLVALIVGEVSTQSVFHIIHIKELEKREAQDRLRKYKWQVKLLRMRNACKDNNNAQVIYLSKL